MQNTRNHAKIHVHLVEKGISRFRNGWDLFCTEESDGQSIELHSHILQNIDYERSDVNSSRTMPRREAERGARRLVRRTALKWWMLVGTGTAISAPCLCGERRDIPERIQLGARDDRGSNTGTGLSLFRTFGKEQPDQKLHERIILKGGCFLNAKTAEKSSLSFMYEE